MSDLALAPADSAWKPRPIWIAALILVGIAFFCNEHNVGISRQSDYTDSPEQMLASASGGNMLRRLSFFGLAALGCVLGVATGGAKVRWLHPLGILMGAMFGLCVLSIGWASDPGMCMRRVMVLGFCFVGALGAGGQFSLRDLCFLALGTAGGCIAIGVMCEVGLGTFRPWSGGYRFSGTLHPNTQGSYLATACLAALCLTRSDPSRRWFYWSAIAVGVVLLILTKSRTSTAGTMAMLGGVWWLMQSMRTRVWLPILGVGLASTLLMMLLLMGIDLDHYVAKVMFMGRQEDTESFSGRTTIWPAVWYFIDRHYWLGYGYECFWSPDHIETITEECQWGVREAHSAYLDTMLSLGIVGVTLLTGTVLFGSLTALVRFVLRGDPAALFWVGLPLNGLFNGLLESGMVMTIFPTFIIAAGFARMAYYRDGATATSVHAVDTTGPRSFAAEMGSMA